MRWSLKWFTLPRRRDLPCGPPHRRGLQESKPKAIWLLFDHLPVGFVQLLGANRVVRKMFYFAPSMILAAPSQVARRLQKRLTLHDRGNRGNRGTLWLEADC
jgi:hypothetical protein